MADGDDGTAHAGSASGPSAVRPWPAGRRVRCRRFHGPAAAARVLAARALIVAVVAATPPAAAYHQATEPADGTVASLIQVEPLLRPASVAFVDGAGRAVRLADFRGRVVLLNIWATWCPPCLREMPALDRLQARLGGRDFAVVPLSIDKGGRPLVERFYARLGVRSLGIYLDPEGALRGRFPLDVLPATFILDRGGNVVAFVRSFVDWDAPEAAAVMRGYIAVPAD